MIEKGMGRTRLGRFAAVTVPAAVATAGLGFAIVTGSVSAALSSAGGFDVGGSAARADGMLLTLNQTDTATSSTNITAKDQEAALVTLQDGFLDGMCLAANQSLPFVGTIGLKLAATGTVGVGDIDLNASQVNTGAATLPSTTIGIAASAVGQTGVAAGNTGGFGLKTNAQGTTGDDAAASNVKLADLSAKAYQLTLNNGLAVDGLDIGVKPMAQSCS